MYVAQVEDSHITKILIKFGLSKLLVIDIIMMLHE
jgi:hypothetical protein